MKIIALITTLLMAGTSPGLYAAVSCERAAPSIGSAAHNPCCCSGKACCCCMGGMNKKAESGSHATNHRGRCSNPFCSAASAAPLQGSAVISSSPEYLASSGFRFHRLCSLGRYFRSFPRNAGELLPADLTVPALPSSSHLTTSLLPGLMVCHWFSPMGAIPALDY